MNEKAENPVIEFFAFLLFIYKRYAFPKFVSNKCVVGQECPTYGHIRMPK